MTRGERTNKPGLDSRVCLVDGCYGRAPGSHPFCRAHARQIQPDLYLQIRFNGTDENMSEAMNKIKA